MNDILKKIDRLRKERGWSVNYLAMEAELTQSTLSNLFARDTEPRISTLRPICNAFGMSLSDFFAEEKEDDELLRRINSLSPKGKDALLQLLREFQI